MRVQWVHPSWRDLVVEHLASDPRAREHFLRSCGINGALLALSLAGGTTGERQRPLLIGDTDWDALTDRIYALVPELDGAETAAMLEMVTEAIRRRARSDRGEAEALARMLLVRLRRRWDAARTPIPLAELEAWLTLAEHLVPEPDPPSLDITWAELLPAHPPSFAGRQELERFADWLTLAGMLRNARPDVLNRLGFRLHYDVIEQFLRAIEDAPHLARLEGAEPVVRALREAASLFPHFAVRGDSPAYAYWLEAIGFPRAEPERPIESDDPDEPRQPRLFDVSRVLADL